MRKHGRRGILANNPFNGKLYQEAIMSNGNQIAVLDSQVIANINGWGQERFLPFYQGRNFDAWKQDAALAIIENKDLRACMATEAGKISIVRALQRSASSGLSLNPQKGESSLVAIGGEVNFWPMKNGLCKAALASGALEFIEANTVYEGDTFTLKKTAKGDDYDFVPAIDNRGKARGFFAVAVLKGGRSVVEYWPLSQAEEHMKKWGKGLDNPKSAWSKNRNAMHEKGVLKALVNGLHLPEAVMRLVEMDNEAERADMVNVTPEPEHKGTGAEDLAAQLAKQAETETPQGQEGQTTPAAAKDDALF
jgi:recombinational DNA repair protein RecT